MANAGKAAGGALSGAASGAALGSVVPGIGTAIGAIGGGLIGGLSGLFGGSDYEAQSANILNPADVAQYNADRARSLGALDQQQSFVNALNAQNGIANQSSVFNQLQGVASGAGPNPAQAMLAQATGANVANQAALMAGQRGAGANAGLIARQAAMQGGALQQNAAGQAATMQAQQSLGALNQMGGVAGQQVANQAAGVGNLNQFAQGQQGLTQAQINAQNAANVAMQSNINNVNAGLESQSSAQGQEMLMGGLKGIGAALPMFTGAGGGKTPAPSGPTGNRGGIGDDYSKLAHGGEIEKPKTGPQSFIASHFAAMAKGGVAAVVPGRIPKGPDSVKNDTVPAILTPGEIVIPKSIAQGPNAAKRSAEFVAACLAKRGK